ncbi:MAG TPA: NUDIX hydrolase [Anaerolineales bacterium]|nr:NUDIX hydrolase [Anaerolineales bacterium]
MAKKQTNEASSQGRIPTLDQVSAGGVAFRFTGAEPEIAIVCMKPKLRWQLPKGIVDEGEAPETTAVREVREEAGVETERRGLIETIEYWYRSVRNKQPVRYHKFVHFYLLEYRSGDVSDHDHEVEEARWVSFAEALKMLEFKSEREVVEKARDMISKQGKE